MGTSCFHNIDRPVRCAIKTLCAIRASYRIGVNDMEPCTPKADVLLEMLNAEISFEIGAGVHISYKTLFFRCSRRDFGVLLLPQSPHLI